MSAIETFFLIAGNLVALVGGAGMLVRWFRNWLIKQVAEPVARIEQQLSLQRAELDRIEKEFNDDIKHIRQSVTRAHERIDRVLGVSNA